VNVEIWSDIACPWCYVGKRRFEAALASFEHRDEVTVTWRSFELDPGAPAEREEDLSTHLAAKYGTSREQALAMHDNMTQIAAGEGWTSASTSPAAATRSTRTACCTSPPPTAASTSSRSASCAAISARAS
jgi:predicted DsbA family dithiol-disulfide isomerase